MRFNAVLGWLLLVASTTNMIVDAQFCANTCPPINYGVTVPSLCEGDAASSFADVEKTYSICHPVAGEQFKFSDFAVGNQITVISNYYVGCNAGRRESGVFAHVAQRYYNQYGNQINFISSLKGGSTCQQWADIYQSDALRLFPSSDVVPKEMPLTVLDQFYEIRDDFFTAPFGHPSYVVLDANLDVKHKFIGPCCGYEDYFACTDDIALRLNKTLSWYLDAMIVEAGIGQLEATVNTTSNATITTNTSATNSSNAQASDQFSEWSPCSVTCGTTPGIQFRWRGTADKIPVETQSCVADQSTCNDEGVACVPEFGKEFEITTVASGFNGPRDVAFHPTPGLHLGSYSGGRPFSADGEEAWIVNGLNHSVSIVSALGTDQQTTISRRDRGNYHYMANATALSFNTISNSGRSADRDSYNYWAICNDNMNTYLGTKEPNNFMGPTLYNSDPRNRNLVNRLGEICNSDEECYFLHSDMLHETPACVGIAHDPETVSAYGNVYWVFDSTGNGMNGQLVRSDFQQPHGPGSMDHSIAAVRRYPGVTLTRGPTGVHAGMVVHPSTRELFIAVTGENKIIVVNTDSGTFARTAREEYPIFSNRLPSFEYSIWECEEKRDFATGVDMPSGLALSNDGTYLYAAERGTGNILVFEVSSGALLKTIETGFMSIGGMSVSPSSGTLHFVDENTNTLNAVRKTSECISPFESRMSVAFNAALDQASESSVSLGFDPLKLYRNYSCVADPVVPDSAFFDQVHIGTGYDSDNPDVQSTAGMDADAALLANRTDCGYDSELNFDSLLLGGYFCHQCLPANHGAECDAGGTCTNVQWSGYICDNEFLVSVGPSGNVFLSTPNMTTVDPGTIDFHEGVTYRFTIRSNESVCLLSKSGEDLNPVSLPGNIEGCATNGPLLVPVTSSLHESELYLSTENSMIVLKSTSKASDVVDGIGRDGDTSQGSTKGIIIGASLGGAVTVIGLVCLVWFIVHKRKEQHEMKLDHNANTKTSGESSDEESSGRE